VFALERGQKSARRGGGSRRSLDLIKRPRELGRRDLLALVGFDLGQDICH
jgi:hypothetical protein